MDIALLLFVAAIASLIYLGVFMGVAYPKIPIQLGGGAPQGVRLLLKEEALDGAKELGLPITHSKNLTDRIDVVYDGSESYIIRLDDGRIVELKKDFVAGAVVQ